MNGEPENTSSTSALAPALAPMAAEVSRGEQGRIGLLGLNAWIVAVLVPALHAGYVGLATSLATALPLALLAAGVLALPRQLARARWALLAGYPVALAAALAGRPELTQRDAYGPLGLSVAAVSLLAFVAATAHAVGQDRATKTAQAQPLVGKEPVSEPGNRRLTRRALLAVTALGALALTVVAPTLASRRERLEAWGEAADDATVLAVVLGTIASGLALGVLVGPTLRASRTSRERPTQRRLRVATALIVAATAAAGWLVLRLWGQ